MHSLDQWKATWQALGIEATPALEGVFDDLVARYSEPHRRYHTLRHLDECFARLDELQPAMEHPAEIDLALWFHDAVYDTRSTRNESRSAALASETVLALGGPADAAGRIETMVMATRHTASPGSADARVLVDADLSILGATPARFDEYERQVREEYAWVPAFVYKRERRKILRPFLGRPAIFHTEPFRARFETQARANIARSLGE